MNGRTLILVVMAIAIAILMILMIKNRSSSTSEGSKVLVATSPIPAGTFLRADKNMSWVDWPKKNLSPSFITTDAHKIEEFNGGVARRDIVAEEPLTAASIVKPNEGGFMSAVLTPGKRAISIAVNSTSGNAGFIFPGDKVDLILTHKMPDNVLASETFIEDLRVLAIDQMLNNPDNKAVIAKTITLEVTPKQAEMINVAISIGTISASLRSLAQSAPDNKPANDNKSGNAASGQGDGTDAAEPNFSTSLDVSKVMDRRSGSYSGSKVSVYHGSATAEQLNFQGGHAR